MLSRLIHKNTAWQGLLLGTLCLLFSCRSNEKPAQDYLLKKTADFSIDGNGSSANWEKTTWTPLTVLPDYPSDYTTAFKLLYSEKGIYALFKCTDSILTNTLQEDRTALYNEDVIELFLQPDSTRSNYFEYELSPLNFESPLLIFNNQGDLNSWHPFEITEQRKILHATSITGSKKEPGARADSWMAECFIPFDLLRPVNGHQATSGDRWKANFYRIDYDKGEALWAWRLNSGNFHEFEHFGTIIFE